MATAWVVCPQRSSSFYLPLKASVELPRHVALRPAHSHPGDCLLVSFPRRSEVILGKFAMDRCAVGEFVSWQRQTKRCFAEVSIAVDNSVVRAPEVGARSTGHRPVHACPLMPDPSSHLLLQRELPVDSASSSWLPGMRTRDSLSALRHNVRRQTRKVSVRRARNETPAG